MRVAIVNTPSNDSTKKMQFATVTLKPVLKRINLWRDSPHKDQHENWNDRISSLFQQTEKNWQIFTCFKKNPKQDSDKIHDWQTCCGFIFAAYELSMRCTGRLNIHSARHMLLLLHLSASGIPMAAACAEAAICTDKSLINTHKQLSDPLAT